MARKRRRPRSSSSDRSANDAARLKVSRIRVALERDPVDVDELRALARSRGGLVYDALRRKAWPKLLGLNRLDARDADFRASIPREHRDRAENGDGRGRLAGAED